MFFSVLASQAGLLVIALLLLLLYAYRNALGSAPLYLMTGMYYIFALLVDAPHIPVGGASTQLFDFLGDGALWLPFLALLLVIYEVDGTETAQRFFLGLVFASFCFICLILIISGNFLPTLQGDVQEYLDVAQGLFSTNTRVGILVGTLSHLALFILMPLVYQALFNQRRSTFLAFFCTMLLYMMLNEAVLSIYVATQEGIRSYQLPATYIWLIRMEMLLVFSLLGNFFILMCAPPTQRQARSALTFLSRFARFFMSTEELMQSLNEWAERYRIVIENSSELILLSDSSGHVINANKTAMQYLGSYLKEPSFTLNQAITQQDGSKWELHEVLPDSGAHGHPAVPHLRQFQNLHLHRSGHRRTILDVNVSQTTYNGRNVAVVIARDVTEQRKEALRRKREEEQRMHSQRLEALGQLAGGVAHDFNNLLQALQASIDSLKRKVPQTEETGHLFGNINQACDRASTLTSQLLGFARKGSFHAERVDVPEMLRNSLQLFQTVASDIVCRVLCEPVPLVIYCDSVQIGQVVLNMLLNARDAMAENVGEKRITLRAERAHAEMPGWEARTIRDAKPEEYLCIHVRDNGSGMDEETRRHIFDPFFTTKPIGKGTGMGLAMAVGVISNHHGWLHVSTAPGKGCDMMIFLPRAK